MQKPLDNMSWCTHFFHCMGKKCGKVKSANVHRLYAINVNKIKLNLFVCWVHFTVCLFVLVKQKQKANVSARMFVHELMSCLKCILDVTTQYYIKCLPCHTPVENTKGKDWATKQKGGRQTEKETQRTAARKKGSDNGGGDVRKVAKVFGWHVRLILRKMSTNLISDSKKESSSSS